MRHVIHIFGASGAGTSTLGRYLCERLGYYHMDTDDYFWAPTDPPYTLKRDRAERLARMRADILAHDNVVISGALTDWGDALIPLFTLVIRVDTATDVRIARLKRREREKFGPRVDPGGDMHEAHQAFLTWAAAYDDGGLEMRSKASHDAWQTLLHCPLLRLDGSLPPEENDTHIKPWLR